MVETRHQFRETLKELEQQTLGGLDMVTQQLDRALESVSYQDIELAGIVVADDDRIDGRLVEVGPTEEIFTNPSDPRTEEYVTGKFG